MKPVVPSLKPNLEVDPQPRTFSFMLLFHHSVKGIIRMKLTEIEIRQKTWEALLHCTEGIGFLKEPPTRIQLPDGGEAPDLAAMITLPEGEQRILFECKSIGQPRVARNAVNQILRYLERLPDSYGVFVAPYISPKSAEICSKEGIGYLDFAGNCRLSFGRVYIERKGTENPFAERRALRSLYSPKASRILRVLLNNPMRVWKVESLAEEAKVSLGLVSKVKALLRDREWITVLREGLRLAEPEALLQEWSQNYTFRKNYIRDFYSRKTTTEIESQIAEALSGKSIKYAFTGFSGAARLAPVVIGYQRVMVYVEDPDAVASLLGLKSVSSGANVSLLVPYEQGVFYGTREFDGVLVASPIQIYLDLVGYRGRGVEAAKEIFEQALKPTW